MNYIWIRYELEHLRKLNFLNVQLIPNGQQLETKEGVWKTDKCLQVNTLAFFCTNPVETKHSFNNCLPCSHNMFQSKIFEWRTSPHPSNILQGEWLPQSIHIKYHESTRKPRNSNETNESIKKLFFATIPRRKKDLPLWKNWVKN